MPIPLNPLVGLTDDFSKKDYISEWCAKPYLLANGTFSSSDTAVTISSWNYPSGVTSVNNMHITKMTGFRYFKGTGVFTLNVNASPFHQGLYKLGYVPTGGGEAALGNHGMWVDMHYLTQVQRSMTPGVTIDLGTQTTSVLKIPFVSCLQGFALGSAVTAASDIASVSLFPLVPLAYGSGQDSTVGYTIWFHWEDVSVDVPAYPQSGYWENASLADLSQIVTLNPIEIAYFLAVPQSGISGGYRKRQPQAAEADSKNIGPVTSALYKGSQFVSSLDFVPLLSGIAAPAAWALDIASKVTSVFGWSKPLNLDVQRLVQRDFMFGVQHVNSSDNSRLLSLDQKNSIEVLPGFSGTDVDELSLDVFLTRPCSVWPVFTWSNSDAAGTLLFSTNVSPALYRAFTIDSINVRCTGPLGYLSNYFNQWRGDIVFSFTFVKTVMHSGRVVVSFSPDYAGAAATVPTLSQTAYLFRKIVDLRESNTITVTVPFVSLRNYRPILTDSFGAVSGVLTVHVVDELVAPTTCSQTISVMPWISAAPGFEFAVPRESAVLPVIGMPIQATPQSGVSFGLDKSTLIGGAKNTYDPNCENARKCVGEKITSLRSLLRVARPMIKSVTYQSASYTADRWTYFVPQFIPVLARSLATTTYPKIYGTLLHSINCCFAMTRGGYIVKLPSSGFNSVQHVTLVPVTKSTSLDIIYNGATTSINGTTTGGPYYNYTNSVTLITDTNSRGGIEVAVPNYSLAHSRATSSYIACPGFLNPNPYYAYGGVNAIEFLNASTESTEVLLASSDDFNLGQFVSIPPYIV